MCGIVFICRNDNYPAARMVMNRFKAQRTRGTEGFGYVAIDDGKVVAHMRSEEEKDIEKAIDDEEAKTILFHHRYPTSTPNFMEAAHPIKVSHELLKHDYYVVHNGIISNADELKKVHNGLGIPYSTEILTITKTIHRETSESVFNDSESLAVEIALYIEELQTKIGTHGSAAFMAIQMNKETKVVENIWYGRNYGNPLKIEQNESWWSITSAGGGEFVEPNKLFRYEVSTKQTFFSEIEIGTDWYKYDKAKNERKVTPSKPVSESPRSPYGYLGPGYADDDGYGEAVIDVLRRRPPVGFTTTHRTYEGPSAEEIQLDLDMKRESDEDEESELEYDYEDVIAGMVEEEARISDTLKHVIDSGADETAVNYWQDQLDDMQARIVAMQSEYVEEALKKEINADVARQNAYEEAALERGVDIPMPKAS